MKLKYEYHLQTWGGFYNEEHQIKHGKRSGDFYFDTPQCRDAYLKTLQDWSTKLSAEVLCTELNEGYTVRTRSILHRVSNYKGRKIHTSRDMGVNWDYAHAIRFMENNWYPGFNDYPLGIKDIDYEEDADFTVEAEWVEGAFIKSGDLV